tara:strand:+ start:30520 stop:31722 length:1203 start_codon:yes stop_codon:yes gene_type:complete
MDQFNISKWNRSRYLAETREGTSKSIQLTGLINKALDQVDEFLNVEDFASSVANILKEEYGSHLFSKFMGKLHAELGMDVSEAYTSEWDPETAAKNQEYIKKSKKERELKAARAAFEKAEMDGDIRGQELALAALDLIKNGSIKGLSKPSRLKEMASELGYLNEEKSSLFSQSLVDDIEKEIREITGILEDGYNENVKYQEYKFKDGTGGFAFKWSHAGNWGGRLNLSLSEDGNHTIETLSYYDDRVFNAKTKFKSVQTWEDLSDDDLSNIFRKLQPSLKKNETLAKKALSDEAKSQSDYYANKPDTGRIGYGLSQQPRIREEKENVDLFLRYRDDSSGRLYTAEFKGKNVGLKGANKLLKYYGIDMEVPPQYDEDILDQIVAALKEKNVSAYHIDNKDV